MAALRQPDGLALGEAASTLPTASPALSHAISLCEQCGEHPRLGSLKRCKACVQQAADADRQDRAKAQAKVQAKAETSAGTKRCATCQREKSLDLFHKHHLGKQGRRKSCIACVKQGKATTPPRTPEQIAKAKAAAAKPERRAANRIAVRDWTKRHPLAARARGILRRAVKSGKVTPPPICQIEGCESPTQANHHPNYLKPLETLGCCRKHHALLHSGVLLQVKAGVPRKLRRLPRKKAA